MPKYPFRYAICNEVYGERPFAGACKSIRAAGYDGIEIAPFTLGEYPPSLPAGKRREFASIIRSEGLEFVGLHWIMVGPAGLHATTADRAVRERSWDYIRGLIDLCADLGPGGVVVFGSPKQRRAEEGMTVAEARRHFAEGFASIAPHAGARGVTAIAEPVAAPENDVVTSIEEAAALVAEVNHPAVRTMFDVHNAIHEGEPHAALIDRYFDLIRHIHLNELDGRRPGAGTYDFTPVLAALARRNYRGWLSMEVFDLSAGADSIATESLGYIKSQAERIV
jgi:D-psicose/D-tagatose/L-ribulose 3-epimerase